MLDPNWVTAWATALTVPASLFAGFGAWALVWLQVRERRPVVERVVMIRRSQVSIEVIIRLLNRAPTSIVIEAASVELPVDARLTTTMVRHPNERPRWEVASSASAPVDEVLEVGARTDLRLNVQLFPGSPRHSGASPQLRISMTIVVGARSRRLRMIAVDRVAPPANSRHTEANASSQA